MGMDNMPRVTGTACARAGFLGVLILLLLSIASAASGDAPWTANLEVNEDYGRLIHQTAPDVAVDALGNVLVMWDSRGASSSGIYFNYRPVGGDFGVGWTVPLGGFNALEPAIAMDDQGNAYGVWMKGFGPPFHWDVVFMYNPAGGSWTSNTVRVNDDGGATDQTYPDIAVDSSGNAYAIWTDQRNGGSDIYFSYRPAGGSWQANVRVNDDDGVGWRHAPSIAVDAAANVYAVWTDTRLGGRDIFFTYRREDGTWTPNVPINDVAGKVQTSASVAVDGMGNVYAIWDDMRSRDAGYLSIYYDVKSPSGDWGRDILLEEGGSGVNYPRIAADYAGNLYAMWLLAARDLQFRFKPTAAEWGEIEQVNDWAGSVDASGSPSGLHAIAVDPLGNAYAVWTDKRDGHRPEYLDIYFAERLAALDETPPTSLIILDGTMGNSGWFLSPVAVTLEAHDDPDGSGVAYTDYSLDGGATWHAYTQPFIISQEGVTTVLARSADNAGNVEEPPVSEEVKIDLTPPTIVGSRSPDPNANRWNKEDVTVHFDCNDAVSGVASCSPDTTLSDEGGGQSVTGSAIDMAGNSATATIGEINIDKTEPTVVITGLSPNPANVDESPVLVAEVSDGLAGVQSAEWCAEAESLLCTWQPMSLDGNPGDLDRTATASMSGLSPGVYTVKVKGEDAAGNWSEPVEAFLVVYDPDAGFATGGGWIIPGTEPGDVLPGITGEDKANFGFVVKYKKGATSPDGQLEFHYRVGDFNVHSTEMHWMVINSNWAKFQGYATINSYPDGLFQFRVDARDGNLNGGNQEDRFILKVWYEYQDPDTDDPVSYTHLTLPTILLV